MALLWLVKNLGKVLASLEESKVEFLCNFVGDVFYWIPNSRTRTILSNLKYAFPDKTDREIHRIARKNCRNLVEYGALALAAPLFSAQRCKEMLHIQDQAREELLELSKSEKPVIMLGCHTTLNECNTFIPNSLPELSSVEIGILYRPFKNQGLNEWIVSSRSRFGVKLLSRKEGILGSGKLLRDKQCLCILFDQNAGKVGTLITQFGRIVSATELPGIFMHKYNAEAYISNMKRVGFWRAEYSLHKIQRGKTSIEPVVHAHQWLENYLSNNEDQCADWLWSHKRWKTQDEARARFRVQHKKNKLVEDCKLRDLEKLPKKTKLWIRLPNWLGDIVMTLPVIREIQNSRPDFKITLITPLAYVSWIRETFPGMNAIALPKKSLGRFLFYWKLRHEYIDVFLLFTNSQRGDIEAFLTRSKQRFGIVYKKKRPLLTHSWKVPADFDWNTNHQSELNSKFIENFGLQAEISKEPFYIFSNSQLQLDNLKISLLYGSDNSPEKRWPASYWSGLIAKLLAISPKPNIYLFGMPRDVELSKEIVQTLPQESIYNLTAKTNILEFSKHLASSDLVVSNDSGGLHLANSLGTKTIGLFGPTNPIRTAPFFNSPVVIQPEACSPTGGSPMDQISVESVFKTVKKILEKSRNDY